MNENYRLKRDGTQLLPSKAIALCNKLGYRMTYPNWMQLRTRGQGPKTEVIEGRNYVTIADLREWIEKRIGMSMREAIETGRLQIPAELGQLEWDSDNTPVRRTA